MIWFKQSVKIFSMKFSLPTDPQMFSPSKVAAIRYFVVSIMSSVLLDTVCKDNIKVISQSHTVKKIPLTTNIPRSL